jgi:murein L,D-transpeptidase YcbB/YkuD
MLMSWRLGRHPVLQQAALNGQPLMKGQSNVGVAAVQELLSDLGYRFDVSFRNRKFDGIFGDETKRNVEVFQRKFALKADGIVGTKTLGVLDRLILENNILEEHTELEARGMDLGDRALPVSRRRNFVT